MPEQNSEEIMEIDVVPSTSKETITNVDKKLSKSSNLPWYFYIIF